MVMEVFIFHRKITVKTQFPLERSRIIKNYTNFTNLTIIIFPCYYCFCDVYHVVLSEITNTYYNKSVSLYWYFVYYGIMPTVRIVRCF